MQPNSSMAGSEGCYSSHVCFQTKVLPACQHKKEDKKLIVLVRKAVAVTDGQTVV